MSINFAAVDQLTLASIVRNLDDETLVDVSAMLTAINASERDLTDEEVCSLAAATKAVKKETKNRPSLAEVVNDLADVELVAEVVEAPESNTLDDEPEMDGFTEMTDEEIAALDADDAAYEAELNAVNDEFANSLDMAVRN